MEDEIYCQLCGSCGESGCCPPRKCLYADAYISDLQRDVQEVIGKPYTDKYILSFIRYTIPDGIGIYTSIECSTEDIALKKLSMYTDISHKIEDAKIIKMREFEIFEKII